jgi:hypothetical protein
MKPTAALALLTASAATASAAPSIFTIKSIITETGTALCRTSWSARTGNILDVTNNTDASCDYGIKNDFATFLLADDTTLNLYKTDNPPQQLYADRSGMGQGKLGYTTGAQPPPRNSERTGWAVSDAGVLTFNEKNFIACPGALGGGFSIWVSAGVDQPGGNSGCFPVQAHVEEVEEPVSCWYSG